MTPLIDLLGKNIASDEAKRELARFPNMRSEIQHVTQSEDAQAVHYLHSERDGIRIKCSPEGEIVTIFLMSEGKEGFRQFCGELPGDLDFDSTQEDAEHAFGEPAWRRPAGRIGSYEQGELMRFDFPSYSLHLQFRNNNEGLDLVTAMTARSVPGRSHAAPQ